MVVVQPPDEHGIHDRQCLVQAVHVRDFLFARLIPAFIEGAGVLHHGIVLLEGVPQDIEKARRRAGRGYGDIRIGSLCQQQLRDFLLSAHPGHLQRREPVLVRGVYIRPVGQAHLHDAQVPAAQSTEQLVAEGLRIQQPASEAPKLAAILHLEQEVIPAGPEFHQDKIIVLAGGAVRPVLVNLFAIEPDLHGVVAADAEHGRCRGGHVDLGPGIGDHVLLGPVEPHEIDDVRRTFDLLPRIFLPVPLVHHLRRWSYLRFPAVLGQVVPVKRLALSGRIIGPFLSVKDGKRAADQPPFHGRARLQPLVERLLHRRRRLRSLRAHAPHANANQIRQNSQSDLHTILLEWLSAKPAVYQ